MKFLKFRIQQIFLTDILTYLLTYLLNLLTYLTYLLMHNSRTVRARDLISLLHPEMCVFSNRSSYSACIVVVPLYPFDFLFFSSTTAQSDEFWLKLRHYGFTYQDMGCVSHASILCIFHNSQMDCRDAFYAVLCLYSCVTDRTQLSTKSVYWLMSVLTIN